MGNCLRNTLERLSRKRDHEKTIVLLTIGLDNAGKTLILKQICGDPDKNVLPTMGFRKLSLRYKSYYVHIYDLGGSSQIRALWPKYYSDIHGLIYVVDASDISRLSENKVVFSELISHKHISGKPLLLLANKQDLSDAVDEIDLVENMEVERLANTMKCPTRVETCSCVAAPVQEKVNTAGILSGYKWLLESVHKNYNALNNRVKESQSVESANHVYKCQFLMDTSPKSTIRSDPFIPIRDLLSKETKTEAGNTNLTSTGIKSGRIIRNVFTSKNKTSPCSSGVLINKLENSLQNFPSVTNNIKNQKITQTVELMLSPQQLCFDTRKSFNRPYTAPGRTQNILQTIIVDSIPGQVPY